MDIYLPVCFRDRPFRIGLKSEYRCHLRLIIVIKCSFLGTIPFWISTSNCKGFNLSMFPTEVIARLLISMILVVKIVFFPNVDELYIFLIWGK